MLTQFHSHLLRVSDCLLESLTLGHFALMPRFPISAGLGQVKIIGAATPTLAAFRDEALSASRHLAPNRHRAADMSVPRPTSVLTCTLRFWLTSSNHLETFTIQQCLSPAHISALLFSIVLPLDIADRRPLQCWPPSGGDQSFSALYKLASYSPPLQPNRFDYSVQVAPGLLNTASDEVLATLLSACHAPLRLQHQPYLQPEPRKIHL